MFASRKGSAILVALALASVAQCAPSSPLDSLLSIKPKAAASKQAETVRGLIERLLPKQAAHFEVVIDEHYINGHLDKFKIEATANHTIRITGNTGVAAANGLYYYLKNVANCSTSWSGDQLYRLPVDSLPMPSKTIEMVIHDKLRYYQNVCTVSYSMVWWDWARWQREIDWMALRAINLPLAFGGQETVFRRVFELHFNLTQTQVDDYFNGPAFLAWNRMGNIQTWSGPLSENWHQQQEALQKQILERMRNFGMFPVVPGFAGHVPRALQAVLPRAKIDRLADWNGFGQNYSHTYFLQPEDPIFGQINKLFIQEYIKLYGTDHFYNIDMFNEETPPHNDAEYLTRCGKGVYDSMIEADPNGIWVMQGWLFVHEPKFWKQPQVKAMVTSVPVGKLLILDLFSEIKPVYSAYEGYYGQPFIWCMLHNFGGTKGMYGALNRINGELYGARKKYHNMVGVGLTPEGIEQNEVAYEYMMDTVWHDTAPDMAKWFTDYSVRRYGLYNEQLDKAWQLLRQSVYVDHIGIRNHGSYAINKRPRLDYKSALWYQPKNLTDAFNLMAHYLISHQEIVNQSETFVYDMVDVSRQALQLVFDHYREHQMHPQFDKHEIAQFKETVVQMENVLDLFESILQCSKHFLLHNWVDAARNLGKDQKEKDYNEWQARNQVTLWGPKGNIVDYAAKHWSGMVSGYYKPRWQLFLKDLTHSLETKTKFDQTKFNTEVFNKVEQPFTLQKEHKLIDHAQRQNLIPLVNKIAEEIKKTIDHHDTKPAEYYYDETEMYN